MNAIAPITPELICNIEAEAMLLGGLMSANGMIDRVADKLRPEDFGEPVHGRIFSAMIRPATSVDPPGGNGTTMVIWRDG